MDSFSSLPSIPSVKTVDDDSHSNTAKLNNSDEQLARVNQQIEVYKKKIEHARAKIQDANEQIIQHEQTKVLEQKRQSGDDSLTISKIEKEKQILVDRLNHKLGELNKKISHNKELRTKIDEMRQERARYDEIYTKLEHDVQNQTEQMSCELEKGKATLKARDKAISELEALNKQLQEGRGALKLEQEELRTLEEQFQRDEHQSAELSTNMRPNTNLSHKSAEEDQNEEEEYDDEKALDDALAKIKSLSGIADVDRLIQKIEQKEELHFGLFSRIAELEEEAATNQIKITDAEEELKRVQRCDKNSSTQKQKQLLLLDEKQKQLKEKAQDVETKYQSQLDVWNSVRSKIMTVHNELGLSVPEDLIGTKRVTENNVWQYLARIEEKATEILTTIHGDYEDQESHTGVSSPSPKLNDNDSTSTKKFELPSVTSATAPGEFLSELDEDDGDRPLTMKEIQQSLRTMAA